MWCNRVLEVDLTSGRIEFHTLKEEFLRRYVGGRSLGVKLFADFGIVEPEEAPLVLAAGPLAPYAAPAASRISLVSRSPLTRTIFDSNAGGSLSIRLKNSGLDAVIIRGKARKPAVIKISPSGAFVENASDLCNATVGEFTAKLPRNASSAVVGPAAFLGFRYASVMVDRHNAFGRGGLGRLFALKNLKAVVVEAPLKVRKPVQKKRYEESAKAILRLFTASPAVKALSLMGTPFLVRITNWLSILPIENFRKSASSDVERLCAENIPAEFSGRKAGCFACPIRCKRRKGESAAPEFETIALLGASCGVFDYAAIFEANRLANEMGVDTISLGGTLAAFFELHGLRPNGKALIETVRKLFSISSELETLKEGAYAFCEKEGNVGAAMCVKRLELPGYAPRGTTGMVLAYATSNRGGCH
ncbi:MAG: aldehyde:ferredoxin oxidoreductase, partial [Planctomycetota bacterium]|nr:aldehyde:ferredoxin oxidoreductase [Planctomycetota bacterium]